MSNHDLKPDVLAYIQQLEATNAKLLTRCERLERERDAAVEDLRLAFDSCTFCEHYFKCKPALERDRSCFEWRGVKEE